MKYCQILVFTPKVLVWASTLIYVIQDKWAKLSFNDLGVWL